MESKFTFNVTSYKGFENEILDLLNRNREHAHTRQYLDWRYLGEKSPQLPLTFWVRYPGGSPAGMVSLISRPYWINKKLRRIWVLGDISLDKTLRGKGLGQRLFNFMNSYIKTNLSDGAFVIPNEAAQKALFATGWGKAFPFTWYLWVLAPMAKFPPNYNDNTFFRTFQIGYRWLISLFFSLNCRNDFQLEPLSEFDESFDILWKSLPKEKLIIRDRSLASLYWRFEKHPHVKYRILTLKCAKKMLGYIIYEQESKDMCRITDLLTIKKKNVRPMIALFLKKMSKDTNIKTVRVKLNSNHIYGNELRKLAFFRRKEKDVFQFYDPSKVRIPNNYDWFVTVADKDA